MKSCDICHSFLLTRIVPQDFWPRWRHRWNPFTSLHNQKENNNQSKINKQPEVPENLTAWNSDSQTKQQTTKAADCAGGAGCGEAGGCAGGSDLGGN